MHIPDPGELLAFGDNILLNTHKHFVIGRGAHLFDKKPNLAPKQDPLRTPFWHMRCTLCRNKGHMAMKCSYMTKTVTCTYCGNCSDGSRHIARFCPHRLEMNTQLFLRGFVREKIDPNDTHALELDVPMGYKPFPRGHPMHRDYRMHGPDEAPAPEPMVQEAVANVEAGPSQTPDGNSVCTNQQVYYAKKNRFWLFVLLIRMCVQIFRFSIKDI